TGGNWITVGGGAISAGEADNIHLCVSNGTPYVAYRDNTVSSRATVMKFNGSSWTALGGAGFTEDSPSPNQMAFYVSNGTPYLFYNGGATASVIETYSGGAWVTVGAAGFATNYSGFPSIVVANGTPYVGYTRGNATMTVMGYNGSSWQNLGTASFGSNV